MKCLESFLETEFGIDLSSLGSQQIYACRHFNGLSKLLSTCYVLPNEAQLPLPVFSEMDEHKAVVDQCIMFMLVEKSYRNILTYGYRIGSNQNVSSVLHCVDVNPSVALVKSEPWRLLHRLIGTCHFANLLINHALFCSKNNTVVQVSGCRIDISHFPRPSTRQKSKDVSNSIATAIKARSFLYKSSFRFRYEDILPSRKDLVSLRKELTDGCPVPIGKDILNQIDTVFYRMLTDHHFKIKYMQILNTVCPKPSSINHIGAQTSTEHVFRHLTVVLEKLLSNEMFGSKRNKAVIFRFISRFLGLSVRGTLQLELVMAGLRVKDFRLFRPSSNCFGKLDLERSTFLVKSFVSWLFKTLIPRIISTFYYCTEVSSCTSVLFFRHDVWNTMSLPFLRTYLDKFMIENTSCRNHDSYTLSNFHHNRVRIIPKKAVGEFRVIAVPMKGAGELEYRDFQQNLRNVIYPVQCILEHLRNRRETHFKKLYSANQIGSHLGEFKYNLLQKYGHLPKLHFLKFDIDSCYDFIPREKVMSVVRKAVQGESGFFVRSQSFYDPESGALTIRNVINGFRKSQQDQLCIDNVKTHYISYEDLIHTVASDLFQSALSFNGKCYVRKSGLFQGTSLSALLVDLVYDELLEHYKVFHRTEDDETLVLRLADDFLILSDSESRIEKARREAMNGFAEFNAQVNTKKVISSIDRGANRAFSFCALEIDVDVLEIRKNTESLVVAEIQPAPTAKIYNKLQTVFDTRLSYGTTSLLLNSFATVLHQIGLITLHVAEAFVNAFKRKKATLAGFLEFFTRINASAIRSCCKDDSENIYTAQIRLQICSTFLTVLLRKRTKFEEVVKFLRSDSIKLMRTNNT